MTLERYRCAFIVFLIVFFLVNYAILLFDIRSLSPYVDSIELLGLASALPAFLATIRLLPPGKKGPWVWFLVTFLLFFAGDTLWAYMNHVNGAEPETPSLCDFFYIANSLTCFVGIMLYLLNEKCIGLASLSFDIFISIFASAGLIYFFTVVPILSEENATSIKMLVQMSYPICDFLLVFTLFLFFFNKDQAKFRKSHLCMGLSFVFMFFADQLSLIETCYDIDILKYLHPIFGVLHPLLGLGGLYAVTEEEKASSMPHPIYRKCIVAVRLFLPYALTLVMLVYVGVQHHLVDSSSIWALSLCILLCARQVSVILRNGALLHKIRESQRNLNQKNSELRALNERVQRDAKRDFLTQLFNRRAIDETFEALIPKEDASEDLGLLLIDVDFFKQVNDSFGHQVGDTVLVKIADCIRSCTRDRDFAGRFGGDEFIVVLTKATEATVENVAIRLLERVRSDTFLREKGVSLSIGGASFRVTKEAYPIKELMKAADDALYRAKECGRDQHVMYGPHLKGQPAFAIG